MLGNDRRRALGGALRKATVMDDISDKMHVMDKTIWERACCHWISPPPRICHVEGDKDTFTKHSCLGSHNDGRLISACDKKNSVHGKNTESTSVCHLRIISLAAGPGCWCSSLWPGDQSHKRRGCKSGDLRSRRYSTPFCGGPKIVSKQKEN